MSKTEPHTKPESFTRFEELTRRIMAVPKSEVDQQKAKYEKQKQNKEKRLAKR
jgi:hypothetical protein